MHPNGKRDREFSCTPSGSGYYATGFARNTSSAAFMGGVMATAKVEPLDMKLEVVVLGVSDIDRAKAFYEKLGWRLDADFATGDDWRVVQLTPHNSDASIIFGKGIASAKPGLADGLVLAVGDLDAARADLIARGINVSEVFHYPGGVFQAGENARVSGHDP